LDKRRGSDDPSVRRREFITLISGAVIASPITMNAQQPEQNRRIGALLPRRRTLLARADEVIECGASQRIGAAMVAKSPPDGYTLLFAAKAYRNSNSDVAFRPSVTRQIFSCQ
jgi:hypothetical protein